MIERHAKIFLKSGQVLYTTSTAEEVLDKASKHEKIETCDYKEIGIFEQRTIKIEDIDKIQPFMSKEERERRHKEEKRAANLKVGSVLRKLRLEKEISQSDMAKNVHISKYSLHQYENGNIRTPDPVLKSYENFFKVKLDSN